MILKALDLVIFRPIMLIMDVLINILYSFGFSEYVILLIFCLLINILTLPFFIYAIRNAKEEKEKQLIMKQDIDRINKSFVGEERTLVLNTYYKQNNYGLLRILIKILPFVFEIVFFICTYRVLLSHYNIFEEITNSFISSKYFILKYNITLTKIITIKLLPIAITFANVVIAIIFSKYLPRKYLFQQSIVLIIILIVLYDSIDVILIYWLFYTLFFLIKIILFLFLRLTFKNGSDIENGISSKESYKHIAIYLFFNIIFFSLYIQLKFISASPKEIIDNYSDINILMLLGGIFLLSLGMFGFWGSILYFILSDKGKAIYTRVIIFLSFLFLINYMFLTNTDILFTTELHAQNYPGLSIQMQVIKIVLIIIILIVISKKYFTICRRIMLISIGLLLVLSISSINKIWPYIIDHKNTFVEKSNDNKISYKLSKNGKNVIVIVLDSARSYFIPYIFQEKPELKDVYSGFRYFSNVITHGDRTELGLPAVLGGYEYTPTEMNKRKEESYWDKSCEAYSVLPSIFKNNGYNTTIYDMKDIGIDVNLLNGLNTTILRNNIIHNYNNLINKFFMFAVAISSPRFITIQLYNDGLYFCSQDGQAPISYYEAMGMPSLYIRDYNIIQSLSSLCEISNDLENNYMSIYSTITHPPYVLLQTPDYIAKEKVNNENYYKTNREKFYIDNEYLFIDENENFITRESSIMYNYNSNMGAILCIADFIKFLKVNNIYDNTRIIIVADHASSMLSRPIIRKEKYPLLMVKDFNSTGFFEDKTFMTNADVPHIALEGLINNPINPFTGKIVNNSEKYNHNQIIYMGDNYQIEKDEYVLRKSWWTSVHDNIYDMNNWRYTKGEYVLDTPELPKNDTHQFVNGGLWEPRDSD